MISFLVNLVVVAAMIYGAMAGSRRGLVAVAGRFMALLLGLAAAGLLYRPLGHLLVSWFKVLLPVANLTSYLIILVMAQFLALLGVRRLVKKLPHSTYNSRLNQIGGAAMGAVEMALFAAVGLALYANLPVSQSAKANVTEASLARPLVQIGNKLQGIITAGPGEDLTETLSLLTVDPESERTVDLGFTTTRVRIDPVDEERMLVLVNRERTSRGLSPLTISDKAREVARSHSVDMFARGYFSHLTPEKTNPFDRMRNGGVSFDAAGENLALAPTLNLAHSGLMNSPGHRANILSASYKHVGIGIIDGGRYGLMVTQDFTD